MKNLDWFKIGMVAILFIGLGGIAYGVYECINYEPNPTEVEEGYQKTLEYIGFDGKKHQAIVVNTGQHNWVLVEKR
jgi:hypothetical protein